MVLSQHVFHLIVVRVLEVAFIDARNAVAFVSAVALVVTNLTVEDKVFDRLVGQLTVDHDTVAFSVALVVVASVVWRRTAVQAFEVGEFVPVVVTGSPVHMAFEGLIVLHVLVDTVRVDAAHRVAETTALAVDEVGGELHGHLFAWLIVTFQEHSELLLVVFWHDTLVVGV